MAQNLTTIHKKMDVVRSKLETLDKQIKEQGESLKFIRQQTNLMTRMLSLMQQSQDAIAQMTHENSLLVQRQLTLTEGIADRLKHTEH